MKKYNIGALNYINIVKVTNISNIINTLKENGYNATNQLVGYLTTGDLCYITSKGNARDKMAKFTKEEILKAIINGYLEK